MFITIGLAIAKAITGKKIPDEGARIIGIGAFVALILAIAAPAKCAYDASVISKHEAAQQAKIDRARLEAEQAANERERARDNSFATSQADINEGMENARTNDPQHGTRPVGSVSQSYFDRLREQQQHRPAGKH